METVEAAADFAVNGLDNRNMTNQTLYEALMNFPLGTTGGQYTFLNRLCRENGWSSSFALRAIREYKRFVYLAAISPIPVTPSPAVDQVWHLHLLYTRSYWEGLCQGVLGKPLHHGPTAGGNAEAAKFDNWYNATTSLYCAEFGAPPPSELWPARFNPVSRLRWIDGARFWVLPKFGLSAVLPSVFPLLLIKAAFPVMLLFAGLGGLIWLVTKMVAESNPRRSRRGDGASGGDGFSFLSDGGGSDCGDSGSGDCGGGDGGGGCGGGCGGGD